MNLKNVDLKLSYHSNLDKIAKDFYIPLLKEATVYKRAVGFFSSTIFSIIATGLSTIAINGGKIQLITSPKLSEDDILAIKQGYERRDEIVKNAIQREMKEPKTLFEKKNLNLLANLIADGIMDIKIAITENEKQAGMFHVKMGLIEDIEENRVDFVGSMNESRTAIELNYESIDVYCSWKNTDERMRVTEKVNQFTAIWNNTEPNLCIIDFPELKQEILDRYKITDYINYHEFLQEEFLLSDINKSKMPMKPENISLYQYQIDAITTWEQKGFCGIFDMATGTGKTITGLSAIIRLCEAVNNKLAVFIVCPFQHLVEQWVEDIFLFNIKPIIGYSASSQKDWQKRFDNAIRDQNLKISGREFFCFVCTNATFSSKKVQELINKLHSNALLLVDEAHNFGAKRLSLFMNEKYCYRLALSATIDRHNDEEGTKRLYDYFGEKCIEYTLDRAIREGSLTRYKYFPIITTLNEDEMEIFTDLTIQISKCIVKVNSGKTKLSERGKKLALKRSRLVAGIADKQKKLVEYIKPYINDNHILIYCGVAKSLMTDHDSSEADEDDLRQIDAITQLLGNDMKMRVSQFTSKENISEREILKREFASGENLQALIAIKCLDEGVNIPEIKTAFILASTNNPKEYIQRRGRVLRKDERNRKEHAVIYDFLALPRPLNEVSSISDKQMKSELTLVKNELARAEEFARLAMNMGEAEKIINDIKKAYSINDFRLVFEEIFDYEN
ncbi:MAG: DEAD/DEAH box helicase family protein [Candidatus Cloacimonetes bacterium]|nr:DEAD/DEAH box helicase family protein [Candidatus Cloacimonadota bacterium]